MYLKKITIISLIAFYSLFLVLLSSETFLTDVLQIRQNIIANSEKNEILLFSKQVWEKMPKKKEFLYRSDYYDVKKIVIYNDFVKVTVVKDKLELIIKNVTKNLNSKGKKSHLLSSKKLIAVYFTTNIAVATFTAKAVLKNNYRYNSINKSKFLVSIFHPPCFN